MLSHAGLSVFNIVSYNANHRVTLSASPLPTSPAGISLMKWGVGMGRGFCFFFFFVWGMQLFAKLGAIIFSSDCMALCYRTIFPFRNVNKNFKVYCKLCKCNRIILLLFRTRIQHLQIDVNLLASLSSQVTKVKVFISVWPRGNLRIVSKGGYVFTF